MNLLIVTPFLPFEGVSHAGGKLVHFLLKSLAERHAIHLVTRYYPGEERHFPALRNMLAGFDAVPADAPLQAGSTISVLRTIGSYLRLARRASEVARSGRFDACQVEHTETAIFWRPPAGLPAVLTLHDVIAKPAFRVFESARGPLAKSRAWMAYRIKSMAERRAVARFGKILVLSEEDRRWAERLYGLPRIEVLRYPGGVDFTGLARREAPGRVLFAGALNRPQNIDAVRYFVEKVWPAISASHPAAEFLVAGGGCPEALRSELTRTPGVRLTGYVDSLEAVYATASVFVAPILLGGGVIVKILDALSMGLPVVTTTYGNEGIDAADGDELLVADDPEAFAAKVCALLDDAPLRQRIGGNGLAFARSRFSHDGFLRTVEGALAEAGGK
ncbi:MAG TPA: glycosyltransferase family 4 protein [Candidatus Deferrimicrobiaceae bacterium]